MTEQIANVQTLALHERHIMEATTADATLARVGLALLANLTVGVAVWQLDEAEDGGLHLRWANATASEILGRDLAALVGGRFADIFPAAGPAPEDAYAEVVRSGTSKNLGEVVGGGGGGERYQAARFAITAVPLPERHLAVLFERAHDSGDRRSVAPGSGLVALGDGPRSGTDHWERFFSVSMDLLCVAGFDGTFRHVNSAWEKTLGWTSAELCGSPWLEFVHRDDWQQTIEAGARLERGEALTSFANRYRCKDGTFKWLLWSATPVSETETIYAVARDVTESRIAAEAIRRARDDLETHAEERAAELRREIRARQEAQDRLLLLLESVVDYAIFTLDVEGRVLEWNAGAQRIKGFTEEEIVGEHLRRFYTDRDALSGKPEEHLQTARTQGRVESEGWRVRSDGIRFWAHSIMTPIKDGSDLLGFAVITRDSTERRRLEEQLRHADRLNTLGKLSAGMAHELGTPLNVLMGRAELIATSRVTEAHALRSAEIVLEQGEKMATIIRHLLQFARKSGTGRVRMDLRLVAKQATTLLAPIAKKRHVDVYIDEANEAIFVNVNPRELEQVVSNLVMNAIQATPEGGSVRVETGRTAAMDALAAARPSRRRSDPSHDLTMSASGVAHLLVQDTGSGIAPEHLSHVFDPFFTTKDVGEGTGLGLSIAHGIVVEHGGRIEVQSREGVGSTFSIFLPECAE